MFADSGLDATGVGGALDRVRWSATRKDGDSLPDRMNSVFYKECWWFEVQRAISYALAKLHNIAIGDSKVTVDASACYVCAVCRVEITDEKGLASQSV